MVPSMTFVGSAFKILAKSGLGKTATSVHLKISLFKEILLTLLRLLPFIIGGMINAHMP
jgi:hypothetical protein